MEIRARAKSVEAHAVALEALVGDEAGGDVRWAEGTLHGSVSLRSAPIDVGSRLKEVLWSAYRSVVLTSATLATGAPPSFEYLRERLGLEEADEVVVGSPFDYARQARVVVRADLPDPVRAPAAYEERLPEAVLSAVRATRGGAFVLFTSVASMRAVAAATRAALEADGLAVLVQGEGVERPEMLERFRQRDSVLFGVASFWQGVDVPGDALRHVVIARLPFDVPTHPLVEARSEHAERAGRDPFRDLAVPSAALRLKQGFGRLIRTTSDRGVVTILDSRIATKSYGRSLLGSLPECPVEILPAPPI
jgi:ATP-dependent DNA helicase DinG